VVSPLRLSGHAALGGMHARRERVRDVKAGALDAGLQSLPDPPPQQLAFTTG